MSKILVLCKNIPSPDDGATLPYYHLCKYLSKKNEVFLFYLKSEEARSDILNYTCDSDFLQVSRKNSFIKQALHILRNVLPYYKLKQLRGSFYNYFYYPQVEQKIYSFIQNKSIECIITDAPMAFYVRDTKIPKIVYALDAIAETYLQNFKMGYNLWMKFLSIFQYFNFKVYENRVYNDFDCCIVVSEKDKKILSRHVNIQIFVIPNGVDTDYFLSNGIPVSNDSIVFVGDMSSTPNVDAIMYFCKHIYSKIRILIPSIQLVIVGRNPTKEIIALTKNPFIQVTGSVKDVRPFISSSAAVITPMISGMGIKNKILEAMSMQKVVITTSIGGEGINIINFENGIIANNADDFSNSIFFVLTNPDLRNSIGLQARKTVLEQYRWEISIGYIEEIIEKIINYGTV